MKNLLRTTLCGLALTVTSLAYAAMPAVDVTVADGSGKLMYKGKTGANGTFSTGKMGPGKYVVQFSGNNLKGVYAIVASAGQKKVSANAVAGEKLAKGGVAMKIDVGGATNITGQIAEANGEFTGPNGVKMKTMNGVRYVWVSGGTGSNLGGHWVEEGSPEARNVQRVSNQSIGELQSRGYNPQGN